MVELPSRSILDWAAKVIGSGAEVRSAEALHGPSPWWLKIEYAGIVHDVVLRVEGRIWAGGIATGAAALRVAQEHGLAAPRLLAADLDGTIAGKALTLETALPGSSALPPRVSAERLRAAGAAIAKVHAIPLAPRPFLPLRIRPTQVDDRARERRWATLWRASPDAEKDAVVAAYAELTGAAPERARQVVSGTHSTAFLQFADDRIRELERPRGRTVFVHGDMWGGNMRWDGERCIGLIDWKTAGAGDPGVDLGELRMQMAYQYGGEDTADHVLEGWERETGRKATDVPYWDAVAALNTPADLHGWPGFEKDGNPVDREVLVRRRDAFLQAALDRL